LSDEASIFAVLCLKPLNLFLTLLPVHSFFLGGLVQILGFTRKHYVPNGKPGGSVSAEGHVWTAPPWQELSELLQHWSGAVMCPACFVRR
jgi:hypothetical protein